MFGGWSACDFTGETSSKTKVKAMAAKMRLGVVMFGSVIVSLMEIATDLSESNIHQRHYVNPSH